MKYSPLLSLRNFFSYLILIVLIVFRLMMFELLKIKDVGVLD
jgi:hypothetical protein